MTGRGRCAALLVILSGPALLAMVFTVPAPILSLLAADLDHGRDAALMAQLVMSISGLGVAFGGLVVGWLARRLGVKGLVLTALPVFAICGVVPALIENQVVVFASRFVLGVAAIALSTSSMTLLNASYADAARARMLGVVLASGGLWAAISSLMAGAVAQHFGWRSALLLYALACVVLLAALRLSAEGETEQQQAGSDALAWRKAIQLWPVYGSAILLAIIFFLPNTQASFVLSSLGVTSASIHSYVFSAGPLAAVLGSLSFGLIESRAGPKYTFCIGFTLLAVGVLLFGAARDATGVMIALAFIGLGGGILNPFLVHWVMRSAQPEAKSISFGLLATASYVGDFLCPLAVAPLRMAVGIHAALLVIGVAMSAVAVLSIVHTMRSRLVTVHARGACSPGGADLDR